MFEDCVSASSCLRSCEFQFLCDICKPAVTIEAGLPVGDLDWDRVMALSIRHRVAPTLFSSMNEAGWKGVPENIRHALEELYRQNSLKSLRLAGELVQLRRLFDRQSIPWMVFKGMALAAKLYGGFSRRYAGDIDVIVPAEHAPQAKNLLLESGYRLQVVDQRRVARQEQTMIHCIHHYEFFHTEKDIRIELHWRLAKNSFHNPFPLKTLWDSNETISISNHQIPALISPEELLLYLCFHGTRHYWFRLFWLCDIARLLQQYGEVIHWDRLFQLAKDQSVFRALSLGLVLAQHFLDAPVPLAARKQMQREFPKNVYQRIDKYLNVESIDYASPSLDQKLDDLKHEYYFHESLIPRLGSLYHYLVLPSPPVQRMVLLPPWLFILYIPIQISNLFYRFIVKPLGRCISRQRSE